MFDILREFPLDVKCEILSHSDVFGDCPDNCEDGCPRCTCKEYIALQLSNCYTEIFHKTYVPKDILAIVGSRNQLPK